MLSFIVLERGGLTMKFKVISRDYNVANPQEQFTITEIEARDREHAWEIVEAEIASNISQDWLLTIKEYDALKNIL